MKSLLTTAIILLITIDSLHTEQADSIPSRLAKVSNDRPSSHTAAYHNTSDDDAYAEEPACVLNQAGNIILPAVKMFQ